MATGLGWNLELFQQNTLIKSFRVGSMIMDMSMNSGVSPVDPKVALTTTKFSDVSLLSLGVVVNSGTTSSNINLPLVLGISIPLAVLCTSLFI
jgi:hypothetical protein